MQSLDAAGFVLAGGKSSRMGRDKALVEFRGQPLIVHALQILRDAGLSGAIAGGHPSLEQFAPVVPDLTPGLGPLGGVCGALASTQPDYAVFVSVDQPLLPPSLLRFLLHRAQSLGNGVTLVSIAGFTQTFPAVLKRTLLPALQKEFEAGRAGCFSAFKAAAANLGKEISVLQVEELIQTGQVIHPLSLVASDWFMNLNSEEDLLRANQQLQNQPNS